MKTEIGFSPSIGRMMVRSTMAPRSPPPSIASTIAAQTGSRSPPAKLRNR